MTLDQQRRYARQIMLAELGAAGQQRLLDAKVLIIGAGGLGSALISYLAAAGIGTIGIVDDDRVELSNLARQIIHETGDIGRLKVDSASDRVAELNPEINVITHAFALTAQNARDIIGSYDVVADGCDNFAARFVTNRTCLELKKPLVSAAIAGWNGQVMTIAPHLAPEFGCYQCLVSPEAPEANTCRESGIIGPLAGIIGSMQALEVMNLLLGRPAMLGKLLRYEGHSMLQRLSDLPRDTDCLICGTLPVRTAGAIETA
ncbi:MAG: HesA/MoeB/ThiF family protein [Rickettsiales bacterium]